jgi:hypothetical protein
MASPPLPLERKLTFSLLEPRIARPIQSVNDAGCVYDKEPAALRSRRRYVGSGSTTTEITMSV